MKRVTSTMAKRFVCELCVVTMEGIVKADEIFFDQVDFVQSFCYLGERLNANGGSKAVVTATRIEWMGSCCIRESFC